MALHTTTKRKYMDGMEKIHVSIYYSNKKKQQSSTGYKTRSWLIPPIQSHKKWEWYYSRATSSIIDTKHIKNKAFFVTQTSRYTFTTAETHTDILVNLPPDSFPVQLITRGTYTIHLLYEHRPRINPTPITWQQHIDQLDAYTKHMLNHVNIIDTNYIDYMRTQPLILCSDGSVHKDTSG